MHNRKSKVHKRAPGRRRQIALETLEHRWLLTNTVFGSPLITSAGTPGVSPVSVCLADLVDHDNIADMIVDNSTNSIAVLPGDGSGLFETPATTIPVVGQPVSLVTGQLISGSIHQDIVVGTAGSGGTPGDVTLIPGNGDGTFQAAINIPALDDNAAIAIGHFVDGGPADIVTISNTATTNNVEIIVTDGNGGLVKTTTLTVNHGALSDVAVGDFGNGHDDIAISSKGDNSISVLLGNGDGTFQPAVDYAAGAAPTSLAIGDFNGKTLSGSQPIVDLAAADSTGGTVSLFAGNGDGTFQPKIDTPVAGSVPGGGPIELRAGNFGNSTKQGLLCLLSPGSNASATVLLGESDGVFQNITPIGSSGATAAAVGDLNGDSLPDIVLTNTSRITTLVNVSNQDTIPPTATVDSSQLLPTPLTTTYSFSVTYDDSRQVDAQTLGDSNLIVTAPSSNLFPGGSAMEAATLVSIGFVSGPVVHATYQITFATPLTNLQDGTYLVSINTNSVANAGHYFVAGGSIGRFLLNVNFTPPSGDFTLSAPKGKIPASVVSGSRAPTIFVNIVNSSSKVLSGKVVVSLYGASTPYVDQTSTNLIQVSRKVARLRPGKGFVVRFKPFNFELASGADYLVANALFGGTSDSNDGSTSIPIQVVAQQLNVNVLKATPLRSTISGNGRSIVALELNNLGNVGFAGFATVDAYVSSSGDSDNAQTQVASAIPVKVRLRPGKTGRVLIGIKIRVIPPPGKYDLILSLHVPANNSNAVATLASESQITIPPLTTT